MAVVTGLPQLGKFLDEFPRKFQKNTLRRSLRKGANVVKAAAKVNIHNVSGELAKGLRVSTGTKGTSVYARLRAKGAHAHIAVMVEYGTRAHLIQPKNRKALAYGDVVFRSSKHPGAQPHAFMRPALDSSGGAVLAVVGESIRADLEGQGINVPDTDEGER